VDALVFVVFLGRACLSHADRTSWVHEVSKSPIPWWSATDQEIAIRTSSQAACGVTCGRHGARKEGLDAASSVTMLRSHERCLRGALWDRDKSLSISEFRMLELSLVCPCVP